MKIFIILALTLPAAFGQLQQVVQPPMGRIPQGQGYYPYPNNPYPNNPYPYNFNPGQYPYQQYPFGYPSGYPYNQYNNNNNNNYPPYIPAVPQFPPRVADPPIVPVPVPVPVDIIQPGITGSVPLSPLEAALTQLDHRNKGHSEKYYYGRHGLGPAPAPSPPKNEGPRPQPPSRSLKSKPDPSSQTRGRSIYEYPGSINYNVNYPGNYVDYPYNYNYPQYPYPQYPQQYPAQYPTYPYNTYYPAVPSFDNVGVGVDEPYIGIRKPVVVDGDLVNVNVPNHGGKKPFSVQKPEHYELYTYHR